MESTTWSTFDQFLLRRTLRKTHTNRRLYIHVYKDKIKHLYSFIDIVNALIAVEIRLCNILTVD